MSRQQPITRVSKSEPPAAEVQQIEVRKPSRCSACGGMIRPNLRVPRVTATLICTSNLDGSGTAGYALVHPTRECQDVFSIAQIDLR